MPTAHHWGVPHPTLHVQRFQGGRAPAPPDPALPQLTQGCPPDHLQDAVSPLSGPRGPTSGEQANKEAGVAHSTASAPQESASACGELGAQPRKHPNRFPPAHPPDPTPKPPAQPLLSSQTTAQSARTQAGETCRRRV